MVELRSDSPEPAGDPGHDGRRDRSDIVVSGIDLIHGAVAVAGSDVAGLVMSKEMFPYRVQDNADVLPEYISLLLRTPQARDIIYGLVTGTSNRTRVTDPKEILSTPLPAPPSKGEQTKVVAIAREALRFRRKAQEQLEQAANLVAVAWHPPKKALKAIAEELADYSPGAN